MSVFLKKASKEACSEDFRGTLNSIGNVFTTTREISRNENIKSVLSIHLRHSNIVGAYGL